MASIPIESIALIAITSTAIEAMFSYSFYTYSYSFYSYRYSFYSCSFYCNSFYSYRYSFYLFAAGRKGRFRPFGRKMLWT